MKCGKFLEFCKFNLWELTFLGSQEATREAKGFATGEAKGCIYCSIIIYPFSSNETMTIENFAMQLLFLPNEHN